MFVRVEVAPASDAFDARGAEVVSEARTLGLPDITGVEVRDLYYLRGETLTNEEVQRIVQTLLSEALWSSSVPLQPSTRHPASG